MTEPTTTSLAPLRWGILGTGSIAHTFATALSRSATAELVAVASRDPAKAAAFAEQHHIPEPAENYPALLANKSVDIVYVATPHTTHLINARDGLRAGKHVLCEKPLGMSLRDIELMTACARQNNRFLMEGFAYRCHPQTTALLAQLKAGVIGRPHIVDASFSFRSEDGPESRLFNPRLGGGSILDVGCYPMSFARMVAGAASGKPYIEPGSILAQGQRGTTGIDEWASALLQFPNQLSAELSCGIRLQRSHRAIIVGEEGSLALEEPWIPRGNGAHTRLILTPNRGEPEMIEVPIDRNCYTYEADHVASMIANSATESPAMDWGDSAGNARALDQWLAAIPRAGTTHQRT